MRSCSLLYAMVFVASAGMAQTAHNYCGVIESVSDSELRLKAFHWGEQTGCETGVTPPLMGRYSPRLLISAGLLVMAVAMLTMTRLTASGSYFQLLAPLVLIGVGMGLSSAPASSASTQVEDPADASAASSLVRASQQIGAALGTSFMTTLAARYTATAPAHDTAATATVHGFASASYWAAGILVAATATVWWLMSKPVQSPLLRQPKD